MSQITQVCLCGFGGQGIILAGLLIHVSDRFKEINLKALVLGMDTARHGHG
jgi:hypothetical protein